MKFYMVRRLCPAPFILNLIRINPKALGFPDAHDKNLCLKPQDLWQNCVGCKVSFPFSLQLLLETYFASINIWCVKLEMPAENHVVHHEKCPLLWSDLKQNGNLLTNFTNLPSVKLNENPFSSSCIVVTWGQKDWWADSLLQRRH